MTPADIRYATIYDNFMDACTSVQRDPSRTAVAYVELGMGPLVLTNIVGEGSASARAVTRARGLSEADRAHGRARAVSRTRTPRSPWP